MSDYHSALSEEKEIYGELDYYENNGNYVFQHDITDGLHRLYRKADVIYSEPAWKDGYDKFLNRAGFENEEGYEGFKKYLYHISKTIFELGIPAYIVMGKHMTKYLKPERKVTVKLHGYECLTGLYNGAKLNEVVNNVDVLKTVTNRYKTVLDFSCGYGNIARGANKFVCSDINPKCVYYIAKKYMDYEGD